MMLTLSALAAYEHCDSICRCGDFLRFFLDLERPEVNERSVWSREECGNISMIQKKHFSSERSLILEFHTDSVQGNHTGFRGRFQFLDKSEYPFYVKRFSFHGEQETDNILCVLFSVLIFCVVFLKIKLDCKGN